MTLTRPIGLTSGIDEVDEAIGGGFVRQQLSYLVGNSGIGKSWLTSWFTLSAAHKLALSPDNTPVSGYILTGADVEDSVKQAVIDKVNKPPIIVFWSLEMAELPVTIRLISQESTRDGTALVLNSKDLLQGKLGPRPDEVKERLSLMYGDIRGTIGEYIFMEFASNSVAQFRQVLDSLTLTNDIVMVAVDYFRLIDEMGMDGSRSSTQEARSASLRDIAMDYDCHVLSIFDINRVGETSGKAPHAYHMKDGTAARYDADIVVTLGLGEGEDGEDHERRHLVFNVEKARFSGEAKVDLSLNPTTGRVETLYERANPMQGKIGDDTIAE